MARKTLERILPEVVVSDRTEPYTKYNGNEFYTPTDEEYIKYKQNEAITNAVYKMLNREESVPVNLPNRNFISTMLGYLGMGDDTRKKLFGIDTSGYTCLNTVTDSYGKRHTISGNKHFAKRHRDYGFENVKEPKEGDIIQLSFDQPFHSVMMTGRDYDGNPVITYSNGDIGKESMRYDKDNWLKDFKEDGVYPNQTYYRFVGTNDDRKKWIKEKNKKFNKRIGGRKSLEY